MIRPPRGLETRQYTGLPGIVGRGGAGVFHGMGHLLTADREPLPATAHGLRVELNRLGGRIAEERAEQSAASRSGHHQHARKLRGDLQHVIDRQTAALAKLEAMRRGR